MIEYVIAILFLAALIFLMFYLMRVRKINAWLESDEARDRIIKEMIEIRKGKNND